MRHGMTSTSVTTRRGFRARATARAAKDRERDGTEERGLFDDVYDDDALDEDETLEVDESDEEDETWDSDRARLRGRRATTSSVEELRAAAFKRDDARSTLQCGRASAIASVVLFLLGFSSFGRASTYSEQSERAKSEYARAVDEWVKYRRAEFASARFEFALAPVGAGDDWPTSTTAWKPTREVTTGDREGVDLRDAKYEALRFALDGGDLLEAIAIPELLRDGVLEESDVPSLQELLRPSEGPRSYSRNYNNTAVMEALMGTRTLAVRVNSESVLRVAEIELFTKTFRKITNWKTCKYQYTGYPHFGGCETYSVVDRLCLKLQKRDGTSEWVLDMYGGDAGCEARSLTNEGTPAEVENWRAVVRHRIAAPVTGAHPALSLVRTTLAKSRDGDTAVVIRSSSDPHVKLLNATGGSASFEEEQVSLTAAGIVLIAVAAVLAVPAFCLLFPLSTLESSAAKRRQRVPPPVQLRDMV